MQKQVSKFETLSEKDKRKTYKSLKIGHEQEKGKVELYREERSESKHLRMQECQDKADKY